MIPFDGKGFAASVDTVLKPWLGEHVTGGKFTSFDDTRIQYYRAVNPDAKAVIVMLHGFTEFFGKFHETAYDFWDSGYTVYFMEFRGHGGSDRQVDDMDLVDVTDFSEYVEDLKCFMDKVVVPETNGLMTRAAVGGAHSAVSGSMSARARGKLKMFLYAHSMGGCVGTMFLEKYPKYFQAAVLSSPMLKMTLGSVAPWKAKLLMLFSKIMGWNEKTMPGGTDFDPDKPDLEMSGSSDPERFMYQFNIRRDPSTHGLYTMSKGSYRWLREALRATDMVRKYAERIRIPVLICQAGHDFYVDNDGQDEVAQKALNAKLIRFPDAKHEIYASDEKTLAEYYHEVLGFFDSQAGL